MSLLVVGAHAMDAELMAGALAAAEARRGRRVSLLHLTRGERGHPTKPAAVFGSQLEEEMAAAATALGVGCRWSGLPAPLAGPEQVAPLVAAAARDVGAKVLITHWKGSWHPSHRVAHQGVLAAITSLDPAPAVLYAENCEDLDGFAAEWFADVGATYPAWLEALRCYELFRRSEPGSGVEAGIPYWAYYTAAARVRGLQAGLGLAEAFQQGAGEGANELGLACAPSHRMS